MRNRKIAERLTCRITYIICAFTLFFSSCQKSDLDGEREKQAEPKPAIILNLDFDGGLETIMSGESLKAFELDRSEEELRSAGINLKRDPQSRQFKVNLDISKGKELPVVVACRRTSGANKQMFVAKTTLTLLTEQQGGKEVVTRKFRIKKEGVQFYQLNADGSRASNFTTFDNLQQDKAAKYEIKLFVSADVNESNGKYLINYGLNKTTNESPLVMMEDSGAVTLQDMQGKVPFNSEWVTVQFYRDPNKGVGLSSIDGDATVGFRIKAQGSILMFKISNKMTESTIELRSLRVYSESLTANLVYEYGSNNNDFAVRPAFRFKSRPSDAEKYFNTVLKPNVSLSPKTGSKTFFFWAQSLSKEYLLDADWIPTSIVAQIKETQGAQGGHKKYWFNVPLLKTYDRLSRLHDGRVTKTELNFEDGTPIHPMNLMAHRFAWHTDGYKDKTNFKAAWRGGNLYYASAYYDKYTPGLIDGISSGYDESWYVTFGPRVAENWRRWGTELEFGKVNHTNPMTFEGSERETYRWRTTSIRELSAIFPMGVSDQDRKNTNNFTNPVIINEQAKMEDYQGDSDFWSIIYRKYNKTYAIRFLRKTKDGQYYMTPYTAAYRYDRKFVWEENMGDFISKSENNLTSTLEIRMRPLGGTTNQYNEFDGTQGYYSPTFSQEKLSRLFSMVIEEANSSILPHDDWWQRNPLKEDDIVREYPALGFWGSGNALWYPGNNLSIMTHDAPKNSNNPGGLHNIFEYSKQHDFKFDWYSANNYAPVILLADRKIIQKNSN